MLGSLNAGTHIVSCVFQSNLDVKYVNVTQNNQMYIMTLFIQTRSWLWSQFTL